MRGDCDEEQDDSNNTVNCIGNIWKLWELTTKELQNVNDDESIENMNRDIVTTYIDTISICKLLFKIFYLQQEFELCIIILHTYNQFILKFYNCNSNSFVQEQYFLLISNCYLYIQLYQLDIATHYYNKLQNLISTIKKEEEEKNKYEIELKFIKIQIQLYEKSDCIDKINELHNKINKFKVGNMNKKSDDLFKVTYNSISYLMLTEQYKMTGNIKEALLSSYQSLQCISNFFTNNYRINWSKSNLINSHSIFEITTSIYSQFMLYHLLLKCISNLIELYEFEGDYLTSQQYIRTGIKVTENNELYWWNCYFKLQLTKLSIKRNRWMDVESTHKQIKIIINNNNKRINLFTSTLYRHIYNMQKGDICRLKPTTDNDGVDVQLELAQKYYDKSNKLIETLKSTNWNNEMKIEYCLINTFTNLIAKKKKTTKSTKTSKKSNELIKDHIILKPLNNNIESTNNLMFDKHDLLLSIKNIKLQLMYESSEETEELIDNLIERINRQVNNNCCVFKCIINYLYASYHWQYCDNLLPLIWKYNANDNSNVELINKNKKYNKIKESLIVAYEISNKIKQPRLLYDISNMLLLINGNLNTIQSYDYLSKSFGISADNQMDIIIRNKMNNNYKEMKDEDEISDLLEEMTLEDNTEMISDSDQDDNEEDQDEEEKKKEEKIKMNEIQYITYKETRKKKKREIMDEMKNIPEEYTIITIGMSNDKNSLIISRMQPQYKKPIIEHIQMDSNNDNQIEIEGDNNLLFTIQEQLSKLIETSVEESNKNSKNIPKEEWSLWWEQRQTKDDNMKQLLLSLQSIFSNKLSLLLGSIINDEHHNLLLQYSQQIADVFNNKYNEESTSKSKEKKTSNNSKLKSKTKTQGKEVKNNVYEIDYIYCFLLQLLFTNKKNIKQCINNYFSEKITKTIVNEINEIIDDNNIYEELIEEINNKDNKNTFNPVILIIDKHIQNLPWESMPILYNKPVSRMPSFTLLSNYCKLKQMNSKRNRIGVGINPENTYYLLNPSNDLPQTQLQFEQLFQR